MTDCARENRHLRWAKHQVRCAALLITGDCKQSGHDLSGAEQKWRGIPDNPSHPVAIGDVLAPGAEVVNCRNADLWALSRDEGGSIIPLASEFE